MAKMFYTLAETAEKLGATEDAVKNMATQGKLQQFRDRDKLMFKRDQVDALSAAKADDDEVTGISSGAIPLDETGLSTGEIPLAGASASDQISLADEEELPGAKKKNKSEDSRMATGISVFDAGEIEEADAHAQTIVKPVEDEEELALESVGSGSGLLDLTQESDDTSLGAELLDEIYPTEGSDQKQGVGSSGAFAPAGAAASFEASGASGLEYAAGAPVYVEAVEAPDPGGTGLAVGAMIVGLAVLVVGLIVAFSVVQGAPQALTAKLAGAGGPEDKTALYFMLGGVGATLVFAVVGWLIGRSQGSKAAA